MNKYIPDYVFESSWEVCNKVGGIYTVLSSKAKTMMSIYKDKMMFIGPDVWDKRQSPWFKEITDLMPEWKKAMYEKYNLNIRIGRWNIPGEPIAVLVDYKSLFCRKDEIYADMWNKFGVDSIQAYGDYDDSCMFAYASGMVIESFYIYANLDTKNVVAHFNEWMLGMGLLYVKDKLPKVATVFTTHATSIGRSIAGNGKPLYNYLASYDGDRMARELNMVAKHSVEKKAALNADCFTTVSDITAKECKFLLQRQPVVTPNGFEKDFIATGKSYTNKRTKARKVMIDVAEKLFGSEIEKDALIVGTSGRYEYRNKGIDVFIDAMSRLKNVSKQLSKDVLAFVMVPAWAKGPRVELQERLKTQFNSTVPLTQPYITHWLHNMDNDPVINQIKYLNLTNGQNDRVKIIFVPSYLNGNDGIFNMEYYDLLIGMDITVFPSYYEPWGYTPHESIAFSVPTITTSLAGFGLWMRREGDERGLDDGAEVITRDDFNFVELSEDICGMVFDMTTKSEAQEDVLRKAARDRAMLADWAHFYEYYEKAYDEALEKASNRKSELNTYKKLNNRMYEN